MCAALDIFSVAALADTIKGTMYTDLTGKFPVRPYKNNQYVFVAYFYSLNAIIVRPMPNHTDALMVATFKDIIEELKSCGHQLQLNGMDNECFKVVQQYITSEKNDIPNIIRISYLAETEPIKVEKIKDFSINFYIL